MSIVTINGIRIDHDQPFDPSYGYSLEALLGVGLPEAPADFEAFWRRRFEKSRDAAPQASIVATGERLKEWQVYDLKFQSLDGIALGGWGLVPLSGEIRQGVVFAHGYGPDTPKEIDWLPQDTVVLFPAVRGFGRSAVAGIPPEPRIHVVRGIEDPDHYIIGDCVSDLWIAVSALHQLFPETVGRTGLMGKSFGGGVGSLALAWDDRIRKAHFEVPTFGHYPLRLVLPTGGSSRAVQAHFRRNPEVLPRTLAYYDAAVAAAHVRVPILFSLARFDPAVAPPAQFAVHNAVPESYRSLTVQTVGHYSAYDQPAELVRKQATLRSFFDEKV